jgi:hypothetical protein
VLFRSAAREKNLGRATLLCDAVRATLGPKSVLIRKSWGSPIIRSDGVSIAEEFDLKDLAMLTGGRMICEEVGAKKHRWAVQPESPADRGHHVGLRSREAAGGAAGKVAPRRGGDPRRYTVRGRDEIVQGGAR